MSELKGLNELSKQLAELGPKVGGSALRSAVNKAAEPALKAARAAAPVGKESYSYNTGTVHPYPQLTWKGQVRFAGFTSRNIRKSSRLSRDKLTATVRIGPDSNAFYATQFVELGTSKMAKKPWLEPSFRASVGKVESALKAELKAAIEKAIK